MNENARQQQNPRIKGSLGGSTKASVQGAKQRRGSQTAESCDQPKMNGAALQGESPRKLWSSLPLSPSRPAHPRARRGGKESPSRAEPVPLTPTRGGRRRACPEEQGPPPSSPGMGQTHIPFPGPSHAHEEGQQPQQRSPTDPQAPRSDRSSHIPPTDVAGHSHSPSPCVPWDPSQPRGTPHPQSEGTDLPPQLRGTPEPHRAQCGGTDPLTASQSRGRGQSHSAAPLRGV